MYLDESVALLSSASWRSQQFISMMMAIPLHYKQILVVVAFVLLVILALALISYDYTTKLKANKKTDKFNFQEGLNTVRGTCSELDLIVKLTTMGFKPGAIFHDLYIVNSWGTYTQIDVVLATKVGIFVFEVKDYSGWISGKFNDNYWTQTFQYGRRFEFYNPIKQNHTHVENLKRKLFLQNSIPFFSVIIFYGDCDFKTSLSLPENTYLIHAKDLKDTIRKILVNNPEAQYPNKQQIIYILKDSVNNGQDTTIVESHISNIRKFAD